MSDRSTLRIQKELNEIGKNPERHFQLWYDDNNIKHVHAMLTGPPHTPYALGMFDFVFNMGEDYPVGPPKVTALTTAGGKTRFNPNIYANGKVCLSILGTWEGEKWSAAHGLASVLISIQSLLSEDPYHNEPGHEKEKDKKVLGDYNAKLLHETIRISVIDRLEEYLGWRSADPKLESLIGARGHTFCSCRTKSPFINVAKEMFLMYKHLYDDTLVEEKAKGRDGKSFVLTRFEAGGNRCDGSFDYQSLRDRLDALQKALLAEPEQWLVDSRQWLADESTTASNLRAQFQQIKASKDYDTSVLMDLEDNNPYAWNLSVVKLPNTYDGGIFRAQMRFHNDFPEVRPRIRFECEVFHPHVSKDGIPYIRVQRPDNVRDYLDALCDLFMADPSSDPSTHLNVKATKMWFGTKEERRDFNRNARRCGQKTLEEC
ncbi:hypothetical protein HDU87_007498 [Geranomyces variabilis]|uniref:UBC core domain-containing protein n=1 Tax=Geranomyces variabilis TaxID=109894 RepID=A0AAD5TRQ1_9FUNG|nr:hypothetical protein HDU87_007498 [Geranomyces variabilis]